MRFFDFSEGLYHRGHRGHREHREHGEKTSVISVSSVVNAVRFVWAALWRVAEKPTKACHPEEPKDRCIYLILEIQGFFARCARSEWQAGGCMQALAGLPQRARRLLSGIWNLKP